MSDHSEICLNCIIDTCDESHPQCLYTIFVRAEKAERQRRYYATHRESEVARVMNWQRAKRSELGAAIAALDAQIQAYIRGDGELPDIKQWV